MPRIVTPLNDKKIQNAKAKDTNYTLSDGNGLQLLIKSSGSKIWEFVFSSPVTKKRRKKTFGNYPLISLAKAREIKFQYLKLISEGIDPVEQIKENEIKTINNEKSLFQNVMQEWFERQSKLEIILINHPQ
ncbi:integrase arm-type DNA-binding domain-containing protein [Aliarcobacter cryaerophilus]|uniref:integrase arm-type DNA-binding domain-containing protein n=1 Tax=Aliarcobacter cryaerophilus TaxID=28198 RepID=UPI003DA2F7A1